jgi:hypothetical protein
LDGQCPATKRKLALLLRQHCGQRYRLNPIEHSLTVQVVLSGRINEKRYSSLGVNGKRNDTKALQPVIEKCWQVRWWSSNRASQLLFECFELRFVVIHRVATREWAAMRKALDFASTRR